MESTAKYNTGHIFVAVLSGTLLGAITALLVAPKSGRDTRQQIAGYYQDARSTISRVPEALRSASQAAKEVIAESNS